MRGLRAAVRRLAPRLRRLDALAAALLALYAALALSTELGANVAGQGLDPVWAEARQRGTLRVAIDLGFYPFTWVDEAGQSMTLGDFRDIFREMHGADGLVRDHLFDAYALFLGWVALGWAAVGLVFSAWVVPTGQAARLVVWGLTLGVVGLLVNGLDREGRVGPRLCGALMALTSLVVHAAAANDFFGEDLAPDPALGVWVGGTGLLLVAVGCIVGTRDERVPAWA